MYAPRLVTYPVTRTVGMRCSNVVTRNGRDKAAQGIAIWPPLLNYYTTNRSVR